LNESGQNAKNRRSGEGHECARQNHRFYGRRKKLELPKQGARQLNRPPAPETEIFKKLL
jgi:hypothetical protein